MAQKIDDDLDQFLALIPKEVYDRLKNYDLTQLIEVVLDLGRLPEARFIDNSVDLGESVVDQEMIDNLVSELSFGEDNRAGLSGTLHRISAIKDRTKTVVGLTLRVGRAIYGTAKVIEDVLKSGKSVLILGRPGSGKTTVLRDAARMLSSDERKRVIVVDTSNEIAGDGPLPHRAIGRSRRMQVPNFLKQHLVLIEAVENHMPEVLVIDEIGHAPDVAAARTIAERGVQLIGTAHGITLENIIENPMLTDLVGGIHSVILGDQQALQKGCKKTVQERKHSPTFDVAVEILSLDTFAVHHNVGYAIDELLSGRTPVAEIRKLVNGAVEITRPAPVEPEECFEEEPVELSTEPVAVYTYGLSRDKVLEALDDLGLDSTIVDSAQGADMIVVLAKKENNVRAYKKRAKIVPVQSNTTSKIYEALKETILK